MLGIGLLLIVIIQLPNAYFCRQLGQETWTGQRTVYHLNCPRASGSFYFQALTCSTSRH